MAKIDANTLEIMANIIKSPADTVAIVKGSNGEISASTISGIAGMTSSLASIIATNPELKAGLSKLGLGASMVGLGNDIYDISFKNKTDDKTLTSLTPNVLAVAGGIVALGSSPVIATGLLVAGTGMAVWSAFETDNDISEFFSNIGDKIKSIKDSLGDIANNLEDFIGDIANAFSNEYQSLTESEREGLAYQITNGDLSGILYGAYNPSSSQVINYDPLILDLNGDGVNTISLKDSKAFFDLSGDGMSEQTAWVDSNDGLLVYDKNGNGKIDDISELFGNANQSGFSELKQLFDANNDNVIDDKDINFSKLKVWQDINGDGISQANELKTLDELGITSINLKATSTNIDSNGNKIKATSTFTQNGEIKQIADVDLVSSKMLTDYSKDYTLTIDALILPWLRGYGTVL